MAQSIAMMEREDIPSMMTSLATEAAMIDLGTGHVTLQRGMMEDDVGACYGSKTEEENCLHS